MLDPACPGEPLPPVAPVPPFGVSSPAMPFGAPPFEAPPLEEPPSEEPPLARVPPVAPIPLVPPLPSGLDWAGQPFQGPHTGIERSLVLHLVETAMPITFVRWHAAGGRRMRSPSFTKPSSGSLSSGMKQRPLPAPLSGSSRQ